MWWVGGNALVNLKALHTAWAALTLCSLVLLRCD